MTGSKLAYRQRVNTEGYKFKMMFVPKYRKTMPVIVGIQRLAQIDVLEPFSPEYCAAMEKDWESSGTGETSCRHYTPEDISDLYLKFARTPTTKAGILGCAREYGLLGVEERIPIEEVEEDGHIWRDYLSVECGHIWAREIQKMQRAIEVHGLLDGPFGPDVNALQRIFSYRHDNWWIDLDYLPGEPKDEDGQYEPLDNWSERKESFYSIPRNDVAGVANEYLRVLTDKQLQGKVTASVIRDDDEGNLVLVYRPTSLLGVMWLQFAKVLTQTDNTRACLECGKTFEFQRRTRLFCGEACQKKYNRKKLRASRKSRLET